MSVIQILREFQSGFCRVFGLFDLQHKQPNKSAWDLRCGWSLSSVAAVMSRINMSTAEKSICQRHFRRVTVRMRLVSSGIFTGRTLPGCLVGVDFLIFLESQDTRVVSGRSLAMASKQGGKAASTAPTGANEHGGIQTVRWVAAESQR